MWTYLGRRLIQVPLVLLVVSLMTFLITRALAEGVRVFAISIVISIILIRFSLTEDRPYGAVIALLSMIFGILTLLVFNYHSRLRAAELQQNALMVH